MFAIVSGLGHGAVSRLRQSWDKLPGKYQRIFSELQQLMDPSRNMSKYRQLISAEQTQPPIVSITYDIFVFLLSRVKCTTKGISRKTFLGYSKTALF